MMVIMRDSQSHDPHHTNFALTEKPTRRSRLKQDSLNRILEAGAARLRQEGLDGAGIAPVMQDAGLTHGAFYSHFPNKDELAIAAFRHGFTEGRPRWIGAGADGSWAARVVRLARHYLSRRHRDERAQSCGFSALAADAARAPETFRQAYEEELRKSLNAIGGRPLDEQVEHEHYDDAIALLALCVGGLSLARAVKNEAFSARILEVCKAATAQLGEAAERKDEASRGGRDDV
jgi:TetR/AcrR family transcriptional repressor of nem operon